MARPRMPKPKAAPTGGGTGGRGGKGKGKDAQKEAMKSDTKTRVDEAIATLEFELHLQWLNMNGGIGTGDFEEFKESWVKNYVNAATAIAAADRPEKPPKSKEPKIKKLNEEKAVTPSGGAIDGGGGGKPKKPKK